MQKQELKTVRLMRVRPNIIGDVINVECEVVSKEVDFSSDDTTMLDFFYKNIGCDCIDIVSFGGLYNPKGFSVTVDDEGLLKSGNVVLKYTLPIDNDNHVLELSGTILIGKCDYVEGRDEDGLNEVGLSDEEIKYIKENLQIELKGVTR